MNKITIYLKPNGYLDISIEDIEKLSNHLRMANMIITLSYGDWVTNYNNRLNCPHWYGALRKSRHMYDLSVN